MDGMTVSELPCEDSDAEEVVSVCLDEIVLELLHNPALPLI